MKITVTRAFNDLTIPADQERRREVGTVLDVSVDRAAQLVRDGFAEMGEAAGDTAAPTAALQPGGNVLPTPEPVPAELGEAPTPDVDHS